MKLNELFNNVFNANSGEDIEVYFNDGSDHCAECRLMTLRVTNVNGKNIAILQLDFTHAANPYKVTERDETGGVLSVEEDGLANEPKLTVQWMGNNDYYFRVTAKQLKELAAIPYDDRDPQMFFVNNCEEASVHSDTEVDVVLTEGDYENEFQETIKEATEE